MKMKGRAQRGRYSLRRERGQDVKTTLSPGERVPEVRGRVRGRFVSLTAPKHGSHESPPELCARTPPDPPAPARSESAASVCQESSSNPPFEHLCAFGSVANGHLRPAQSPGGTRRSRNRQPIFRCGIDGGISHPTAGLVTSTRPLFRLASGCGIIREGGGLECAWGEYSRWRSVGWEG